MTLNLKVRELHTSNEDLAEHLHDQSMSENPTEAAIGRMMKGTQEVLVDKAMRELKNNGPNIAISALLSILTSTIVSFAASACKGNPELTKAMILAIQDNLHQGLTQSIDPVMFQLEAAWETSNEKPQFEAWKKQQEQQRLNQAH